MEDGARKNEVFSDALEDIWEEDVWEIGMRWLCD
jgi:hypothetical protein